jgi:hypothetical protein
MHMGRLGRAASLRAFPAMAAERSAFPNSSPHLRSALISMPGPLRRGPACSSVAAGPAASALDRARPSGLGFAGLPRLRTHR